MPTTRTPARRAATLGWRLSATFGVLVLGACTFADPVLSPRPRPPAPFTLAAPIDRWDEGIPLGNGLLGALVWGSGSTLRVSLDRGDLWDLRRPDTLARPDWTYATMRRLKEAGDHAQHVAIFDAPYDTIPYPTKLPVGRVEIDLGDNATARSFTLDVERAEAQVDCGAARVEAFVAATAPVIVVHVAGSVRGVRYLRPTGLDRLGYPAGSFVSSAAPDTDVQTFRQPILPSGSFSVVMSTRRVPDGTDVAITVVRDDTSDPTVFARARDREALRDSHRAWWRRHHAISGVRVPDPTIQRAYDFARYLYGAGSRAGAPPMPLQGLWTADEGGLPPWKGDYHHDLNTQTTYLAVETAGLDDTGASFLEWNWNLLPRYRRFAREFFGVEGAAIPGVAAINGDPLGGWGQYSLSPTNGAWVAQSFERHWRFTRSRSFLAERAYPFCSEIAIALAALLEPAENGALRLALSTSPEIFDNSPRAWLPPNANYDQACLRWLFGATAEMARALGDEAAADRWDALLRRLEPLDVDPATDALTFARGFPFHVSHRHFSHAMAIHPFALISVESGERDRRVVNATLDATLARGTKEWCGYSFAWMACQLARAGRADEALTKLEDFATAFCLRNGFHANGDQSGRGLSNFTYRPMTLEGNFLAMEAVHDLLLQSWGGIVRVFPAVSERWRDAEFVDLRAEGGFRVSAARKDGETKWVRVVASNRGELRMRDPFPGRASRWTRDVERVGDEIRVTLAPNEELWGDAPR